MSAANTEVAYYLLWLLAGLLVVALVSASLTGSLHHREARGSTALQLLDALSRYAVWAAAQHRNAGFALRQDVADVALRDARELQTQAFPELALPLDDLLEVDRRLRVFLREQQDLRCADPEAWLESNHQLRLAQLWRSHQAALAALTLLLQEEKGDPPAPMEHGPV
jgi:hypothetical protein